MFLKKNINQVVFVCDNLGQNAILGIDAIEKLGLIYSTRTKTFHFENDHFSFASGKVSALSSHIIPPLTVLPIRLSALTAEGTRPPAGMMAVATVASPLFPLLRSEPGLVTTTQAGEVTVLIQNCSPTELHIQRGDILGSLECIQGQNIQRVNVSEIVESIQKGKVPSPPHFRLSVRNKC